MKNKDMGFRDFKLGEVMHLIITITIIVKFCGMYVSNYLDNNVGFMNDAFDDVIHIYNSSVLNLVIILGLISLSTSFIPDNNFKSICEHKGLSYIIICLLIISGLLDFAIFYL